MREDAAKSGKRGKRTMNNRLIANGMYFVALCFLGGALFGIASGKMMLAIAFAAVVPCLLAAGRVFDPKDRRRKRKK